MKRRLSIFVFLIAVAILYSIGLVLGIGVHSYHAGKILMPVFLLSTIYFFRESLSGNKRLLYPLVGSFLVVQILFLPWFIRFPETFVLDQINYTGSSVG